MWACYNFFTCQEAFWQRATCYNLWHSGVFYILLRWHDSLWQSYLIDLCDHWLNAQWWSYKLLWCTWCEPHIMTDFRYLRCYRHRLKTNFLYWFIFSWYTDRLLHWWIWHHPLPWKLSRWQIFMLQVMINLSSWHCFHFHWMEFIFYYNETTSWFLKLGYNFTLSYL